jgi:glyoxylase-like metal-dependent hydrolase (beta-lactamase superfamily II)
MYCRTVLSLFCFALSTSAWSAEPVIRDYPADKVSEHVWVIHGPTEFPSKANGGFMNNPVIVETSDSLVILDPGSSVHSGRMVLRQAKKLSNKPVSHVFNSHIHGDHWLGNQAILDAYPKAKIYANPKMIEEAKAGRAEEWVQLMVRMTEGATKDTKPVIPTETLTNGQEVKVGGITFRAHLTEHTHTKTDAMIEVVEDRLIVMGDNAFNQRVGLMNDGSYRGLLKNCHAMLDRNFKVYVPGHGPSGGKEALAPYCNITRTIYEEARKAVEKGIPDFEAKPAIEKKLGEYMKWSGMKEELGRLVSLAVLEAEQASF